MVIEEGNKYSRQKKSYVGKDVVKQPARICPGGEQNNAAEVERSPTEKQRNRL